MKVTNTADENVWKATWTNLPKYEDVITGDGSAAVTTPTLVYYKVVESDAKVNGIAITLPETHEDEAVNYGTVTDMIIQPRK